jgi:LacI family transcriptional regulator
MPIFAVMEKRNVKNIKELAGILNLSVTTVSRVLNGKADVYRISTATSNRVMNAARELNYFPNIIARGLKLERTDTLGLIIPDVANPFFASIAKTVEIESRKNGYSLILCDSLDDIDTEMELIQLLAGRKVDGIIIAPVGMSSTHIKEIQQSGIPIIVIDRYFPDGKIPYITSDNYKGAFKAVEHMILSGHKKIACIQGIKGISANTDRVKGYLDALAQYDISVDRSLIVGDNFGEENGYIQARILLNNKNRPTAILALSNLISIGIMRAISEIGLSIPDDISLVSFDEQPYSAFLASPMTTIEQRREEIGKMAVSILTSLIKKESIYEDVNIMLEPRLIIRKSVKNLNA